MKNNKSLGQHWLKDRQILDEIARLSFSPQDPVELCLEIGPGLGTLTSALLRIFPKVISIELDKNLADNLPKSFPGKNLTVINQNFLDFDLSQIDKPYVVSANIPYYITSPIIEKLLSTKNLPQKIVILIQKEVAERIVATKGHSMLSLKTQNLSRVEIGPLVPAKYFTPPPKVDSAVVVLTPLKKPIVSNYALKVASLGFSSPRKKLINNLSNYYDHDKLVEIFTKLNISTSIRPSELSLESWQSLADLLI